MGETNDKPQDDKTGADSISIADVEKRFKEQLETERQTWKAEKEGLEGKVTSMQDSLDSVLEELALKGKDKDDLFGDEEDDTGKEPDKKPAAEPEKKPDGVPPKEGKESDDDIEAAIEKTIKEDQLDRQSRDQVLEALLIKDEMRDIESELNSVKVEYPNASDEEILLAIEDGSSKPIAELAKMSHERRSKELDGYKSKLEGELKERILKENEGNKNVPQSHGSPPTPKPQGSDGSGVAPKSAYSEDAAWGEALSKARVDAGGV